MKNLNKTATKIYSEENLRKAMEMICNSTISNYEDSIFDLRIGDNTKKYISEYIQSLKQPKTPKWFVAETVQKSNNGSIPVGQNWEYELKTTTIDNKTYLIGTYLNE